MRFTIKGGLHFVFLCFIETYRSVWSNDRPAGHNIFSGPQKHSGKICKCAIGWKVCEVAFVTLNCLRWIKFICTRTMNRAFSVFHFYLIYFFYNQIRIGTDLRWIKPGWSQGFFVPRCSLSWRLHLAQFNSIPLNKSIYQSAERSLFKAAPSQIDCPSLLYVILLRTSIALFNNNA